MSDTPEKFQPELAYVPNEHAIHVARCIRPYFGILASGGLLSGAQLDELFSLVAATRRHLLSGRTRPARDAEVRNHLPTQRVGK